MRANVPDSVDEIGIQAPLVKLVWVDSETLIYLRKESYGRYSPLVSYLGTNPLSIYEVFDNSVFVMRLIDVDISAIGVAQDIDLSVRVKKFKKEEKIDFVKLAFYNVLLALL